MTTAQSLRSTTPAPKEGMLQRITRRRAHRTPFAAAIAGYPATRSAAILAPASLSPVAAPSEPVAEPAEAIGVPATSPRERALAPTA